MLFVPPHEEREPLAPIDERRLAVNLAAMTRLHELSTLLAHVGEDFTTLLTRVLDAALDLTGAAKGYIQCVDPATGDTRLAVQRGLGARLTDRLAHAALGGAGAAASGKSRRNVIADVLQAPTLRATPDLELLLADDIRALTTVPIATRAGELLGWVSIQFSHPHELSEDELRFLDLAAGMAADFIERTEAEHALDESEQRFRALLSAGAHLIFRMSPDWGEMRELTADDPSGDEARPNSHWLRDHVHPDDRTRVWAQAADVQISGAVFDLEHRIRRPDGAVRWRHTRAVPLRDADGKIREWFGAATDITDRKDIEEKLHYYQAQLEERVVDRTAERDAATGALQDEIAERTRTNRVHEQILRELGNVQEAERRRISRELHDEVGQQLAALLLAVSELANRYQVPTDAKELRQVQALAQTIATEIHDLAVELRPTALDDLGLAQALAAYAQFWSERSGVRVDFHASGFEGPRLPSAIETAVYRVVQEALTNVKKHAQAQAVSVILEVKGKELSAIVEDDGIGFKSDEPRRAASLGLRGMAERATLVGGELRVESSAGSGTMVVLRVPV